MNTSRRTVPGEFDSAGGSGGGVGGGVGVEQVPLWARRRTTDVLLGSAGALLALRQVLVSAAALADLHPVVLTMLFAAVVCLLAHRLGTWWRRRLVRRRAGRVAVEGWRG